MTILVGSGPVNLAQLSDYLEISDKIIAVDGGLNYLEALGFKPHVILGDFDSYEGELPDNALVFPSEKNFSDMEAALELVDQEETYIFGVTGGRLDHFLSVLDLIKGRENIKVIDEQNLLFYRQGDFILPREGGYFSLFPQEASLVTIEGAKYNLSKKEVLPRSSLLLSNSWNGDVKISLSLGWALVVISKDK